MNARDKCDNAIRMIRVITSKKDNVDKSLINHYLNDIEEYIKETDKNESKQVL